MSAYQYRVPDEVSGRIVAALERIAVALEKANELSTVVLETAVLEDERAGAAFVMREACADEVEKLYGPEAAAQVRLVTLPAPAAV